MSCVDDTIENNRFLVDSQKVMVYKQDLIYILSIQKNRRLDGERSVFSQMCAKLRLRARSCIFL